MSIQKLEVQWYLAHGKHKSRIRFTAGKAREPYVIGDVGWNKLHPDKREFIESRMHADIELDGANKANRWR